MNKLNSNVHDSFKFRLIPYHLYLHLLAQYYLGSNLLRFHIELLLIHLRTYSDTSVAYELDFSLALSPSRSAATLIMIAAISG